MALIDTATALRCDGLYGNLIGMNEFPGDNYFMDELEKILDEDFQRGTMALGNVVLNPPAGTLNIDITQCLDVDVSEQAIHNIATAVSDYWKLAIGYGSPECSDCYISSVVNDAGKIVEPIKNDLRNITGSTDEVLPSYLSFIKAIYDNVKTIQWTVIETSNSSGSDTTYTNTVS